MAVLYSWLRPRSLNKMEAVHIPSMSQPDLMVKLLLLGDASVGKTSIVLRFVNQCFNEDYVMTIGKV